MRLLKSSFVLSGLLLPAFASAFTPIGLSAGWNLVGNSDSAAIDVGTKFSGGAITTVWKWNKVDSRWAFYTPTMSPTELTNYAASKGYDVLSTIDSKEGFWVNANAAVTISDPLSPPPAVGTTQLSASDLAPNWNLVASADKKTPSQLNAALASNLNAASKSISTVWAWDTGSSGWRFYAPSLEANGTLSSYIASKNYLPFTSALAATDGFWVNVGASTTPVTPTLVGAEGVYGGTLAGALSSEFQLLILENGDYWSIYGKTYASTFYVYGVAQGTGTANNGSFISTNLKDFGTAPATAGSVYATYNSTARTISGTMSTDSGSFALTGGPLTGSLYDYNKPALLSTISGSWTGSGLGGETIALNIAAEGAFTGHSSGGCNFSGAFIPRPSGKNVFNVTITFGASPCVMPGLSGSGIAVAYPLTNGQTQLMAAAIDNSRTYGSVMFGAR